MAKYFDEPDELDDGAFVDIRFNEILPEDHPAKLIQNFVSAIDTSPFEEKYKVGPNQKGRSPKGIKMMLGVLLYAIFSRIYSARQIDKATYTYSDFWIFTHKERISHDKISKFILLHEKELITVFLETILLADLNSLLNFKVLYTDGFSIRANASKKKNYNLKRIKAKEARIQKGLEEVFEKLKENEEDPESINTRKNLGNDLKKIQDLKDELNSKINRRLKGKRPDKVKDIEKDIKTNSTDKDSNLMKMKDGSYANGYLKINATDSKSDIILSSSLHGDYDESHNVIRLFNRSNKNCDKLRNKYNRVCFDSGFNTLGVCTGFEAQGVEVISPTRQHENEQRNPDKFKSKLKHTYDEENNCVICAKGNILKEKSKDYSISKGTIFKKFWDKEACKNCESLDDCTESKKGYFTARIDVRLPYQLKALENYLSEEGQKIYKKRMHTAEVFQADLKNNGKFDRFFRKGLNKVSIESTLHDIVWNLRRIFNSTDKIVWNN